VSHEFAGPPSSPIRWYNWYFEIKYFDDAGELQTSYVDFFAGFDPRPYDLDEQFSKARDEFYSESGPAIITGDDGSWVYRNRLYSINSFQESREYDVVPHE